MTEALLWIMALAAVGLALSLTCPVGAQEQPTVGWALDVASPDILRQIDEGAVKDLAMEVRDGALRLTRDPQKHTGAVSFNINLSLIHI